jgi:hypothetical protein
MIDMYIYHKQIYFKIKIHEILLTGFALMDCNVYRKGKS